MFCCIARIVAPGLPHHVTQRGNHRATMFFEAGDYGLYRALPAAETRAADVAVWAWVLMPNHVHLIEVAIGRNRAGRRLGAGAPARIAAYVNARARRTGHLVQERFGSVVMDEAHLMEGLRYVALNPVRAGLVVKAEDWPWSSVAAQLGRVEDGLTLTGPVAARVPNFADLLSQPEDDADFGAMRRAEGHGRPLGSQAFMMALKIRLGRSILPKKRGPKVKQIDEL